MVRFGCRIFGSCQARPESRRRRLNNELPGVLRKWGIRAALRTATLTESHAVFVKRDRSI
jgi:hypothetical protein